MKKLLFLTTVAALVLSVSACNKTKHESKQLTLTEQAQMVSISGTDQQDSVYIQSQTTFNNPVIPKVPTKIVKEVDTTSYSLTADNKGDKTTYTLDISFTTASLDPHNKASMEYKAKVVFNAKVSEENGMVSLTPTTIVSNTLSQAGIPISSKMNFGPDATGTTSFGLKSLVLSGNGKSLDTIKNLDYTFDLDLTSSNPMYNTTYKSTITLKNLRNIAK